MQSDPARMPLMTVEPFQFTGAGGEYFRIWIVNVLLTLLTLGVYSAWAKVRRLQYFYRHTRVAGTVFDFHGQPMQILKGRLIALALFLAYTFADQIAVGVKLFMLLVLGMVMPRMLRSAYRFRWHNSSYRGLRFAFTGTTKEAYSVFLKWGSLATLIPVFLPVFYHRLRRYQHGNSRLGSTSTHFTATPGEFYGIYARAGLLLLVLFAIAAGVILASAELWQGLLPLPQGTAKVDDPATRKFAHLMLAGLFVLLAMLWMPVRAYVTARTQNLVWNSTRLGEHRFRCTLGARRLLWIQLGNFLLVALTAGFYMPWAMVRQARYRAECFSLLPEGSLDHLLADASEPATATGDEVSELFDLDFGL